MSGRQSSTGIRDVGDRHRRRIAAVASALEVVRPTVAVIVDGVGGQTAVRETHERLVALRDAA